MPDLTIENGWMCQTNEDWETEVVGSKGDIYKVTYGFTPIGPCEHDYSCTCPSRKHPCKHVLAVRKQRCGWHSQFDAGEVDQQNPACPKCGGAVVAIRFAV